MLLYKHRKKIIDHFNYLKIIINAWFTVKKEKTIFIDVSNVEINRYLYVLIKMFSLQGYTVFLPSEKKTIKILNNTKGEFRYASWLLSDREIKFSVPKHKIKYGRNINSNQLSNNYFKINNVQNTYHVPMCCYPTFYRDYKLLKQRPPSFNINKSIFMAGNIDPNYYNRIEDSNFFNQPSRWRVVQFLKKQPYYEPIENFQALKNAIENNINNKLIIIETNANFRIPYDELLIILSSFRFYLALPGVVIPQSHNLIEAMSCGCIPVIHAEYAALMNPPLTNAYNAFVFTDLDFLDSMISKILKESEEVLNQMSKNVINYYSSYLTPKSVVESILSTNSGCIYIQGENSSLKLLEI